MVGRSLGRRRGRRRVAHAFGEVASTYSGDSVDRQPLPRYTGYRNVEQSGEAPSPNYTGWVRVRLGTELSQVNRVKQFTKNEPESKRRVLRVYGGCLDINKLRRTRQGCDKLRGAAKRALIRRFPNGATLRGKSTESVCRTIRKQNPGK